MNILLNFSLIVFAIALTTKGEFKPSEHYVHGMIRRLSRETCASACKEKLASCKEYRNHLSHCENSRFLLYKRSYEAGIDSCNNSTLEDESPIVCFYDSMRSTYHMEGVNVSNNYFNEFIDSLMEYS